MYACMHAYMHTYIHTYMHIHIQMCVYIYIYIFFFWGGGERQTAKSRESRPFISLGLVYPLPQPLISNRP